ncbi:MAG: peptide chain release factor N(5)-glutamine methyltransferase [Candidatus Acidiferrales bacterium]
MQTQSAMQTRDALKEGINRLNAASVPSSPLAAELLFIHTLGCDRTWLYTHPEQPLDSATLEKYFALIARRAAGEPTQYIIGKQEFWGLEFDVTPAVLIPRPETEHIIEVAIERVGAASNQELRIADVGTGSGCIAVALAKEFPKGQITATDISPAALEVAKRNAIRHDVADRIEFAEADLLQSGVHQLTVANHESPTTSHSQLATRHFLNPRSLFDLIASNPPYIADSEAPALQREVREHEPKIALFAGPTGLEIYARVIEQAESRLVPDGLLILELAYGAVERVRQMIEARDAWRNIAVTNDLAGIPRVLATAFGKR